MRGECESIKVKGVLAGDSVVVYDHREARRLYACGYYGQPIGVKKPKGPDFDAPLRLSPIEAVYLAEKGALEVERPDGAMVTIDELMSILEGNDRFAKLYEVYKKLREAGLVVRSGLKYGADFTVYRTAPHLEHAPFIIHVYRGDDSFDPVELVRAGRLAHSVRKRFVFACVEPGGISFLTLKWFKP